MLRDTFGRFTCISRSIVESGTVHSEKQAISKWPRCHHFIATPFKGVTRKNGRKGNKTQKTLGPYPEIGVVSFIFRINIHPHRDDIRYFHPMNLIQVILAIIFPPLAVLDRGCGSILIVLILTAFGWVPGVIAALVILNRDN